jgi:hypothetical protein
VVKILRHALELGLRLGLLPLPLLAVLREKKV